MKRRLIIGISAILCLSTGALVIRNISNTSALNANDIESLAACEVFDQSGNNLGGCAGPGGGCWFDNVYCDDGKEYRN